MILYTHRGDTTRAVENTAAAFDAALVCGFRAFELDLLRIKDGTVVVFHDFSLRRLFGMWRRLTALTLPEFRAVFPDLLTFEEFSERYARQKILINLEVKDDAGTVDAIAPKLADLHRVVISSFRTAVVHSAISTGFTGGYLFETAGGFNKHRRALKSNRLHISRQMLGFGTRRKADAALYAEYDLHVYTVNSSDEAQGIAAMPNVKGLFTDNPELLRLF